MLQLSLKSIEPASGLPRVFLSQPKVFVELRWLLPLLDCLFSAHASLFISPPLIVLVVTIQTQPCYSVSFFLAELLPKVLLFSDSLFLLRVTMSEESAAQRSFQLVVGPSLKVGVEGHVSCTQGLDRLPYPLIIS